MVFPLTLHGSSAISYNFPVFYGGEGGGGGRGEMKEIVTHKTVCMAFAQFSQLLFTAALRPSREQQQACIVHVRHVAYDKNVLPSYD